MACLQKTLVSLVALLCFLNMHGRAISLGAHIMPRTLVLALLRNAKLIWWSRNSSLSRELCMQNYSLKYLFLAMQHNLAKIFHVCQLLILANNS